MIGLKAAAAAGVLMGALAVGPLAYIAGDMLGGWEAAGRAALQAQLSEAQGQRDAAQRDLAASTLIETYAREAANANRQAAAEAQERLNDYAQELQNRGPAGACLLQPGDVERLQPYQAGRTGRPPSAGR